MTSMRHNAAIQLLCACSSACPAVVEYVRKNPVFCVKRACHRAKSTKKKILLVIYFGRDGAPRGWGRSLSSIFLNTSHFSKLAKSIVETPEGNGPRIINSVPNTMYGAGIRIKKKTRLRISEIIAASRVQYTLYGSINGFQT